jgi:hypothetical protein
MNCIFIYNRSIYKVTIHLLFAMISVEESKNIYQWKNVYQCVYFRVLFVLFLVGLITQLTCLIGLGYLPAAQAALVLKITLVFSLIINVVCTIVGIITNGSFLGTPLYLIIAVDSGITFGLMMILMARIHSLEIAGGVFILFIAMAGALIIIEVVILLYACLFKEEVVSSLRCFLFEEADDSPCTACAFAITCGEAFSGGLLLLYLYPETLTHEQLYGSIPFLIVLLVYCALKALGAGGLWISVCLLGLTTGKKRARDF